MADEKNGGSDLDIFEGLGKKTTTSAAPAPAPPPPPSMAPVPLDGKRTLLGIPNPSAASTTLPAGPPPPPPVSAAPPPPPPVSAAPPPPPPVSAAPPPPPASAAPATKQTPPPPPGRGSLPNISKSGPPPLPGSAPPPAQAAPAPSTAPQNGASGKLEMDWDDEDEATHVFDKDRQNDSQPNMAAAPATLPNTARGTGGPPPPPSAMQPAAGKSAPPPIPKNGSVPPAPATATGLGALMAQPATAQTLSGHAPPPPPPASGRGPVSAAPPPAPTDRLPGVSQPPPPPPPPGSMRAPMSVPSAPPPFNNTLASAPSVTPPPPPQVTTQPMPMPPRASAPPAAAPAPAVAQASAPPPQISLRSMEQTALVRPAPQSRGWVGIGLGLLAVAIAAGAVVFFLIPRTGTITVNVNDAKGASVDRVDVFVDGKKECETTPCTFKRDNGGHSVKVVAQGFETPEPKQVTVDTGKDVPVAFVLAKGGSGGTGVRVGSATSGLKLYIDGELVGNLPQDVKDLAAGDHKVKVTGGDRYANLEKTITVAKGEMLDLSNVALKVVHGKATIDSTSSGAKVYIVSGSDRRELPRLPLSVELDTSRSWTLEASKFGYNDFRQPIVFEDGQAEKTFTITMDLKGAAPAPGPAPGPGPGPGPGPVVTPPSTASAAATTPTPKPTGEAPAGQATLNINSIPASNVVLDGRPIGQTPKMGFSVSPGAHTVKFINNDQGLSKTVSVSVKAGETKTVAAKLRD